MATALVSPSGGVGGSAAAHVRGGLGQPAEQDRPGLAVGTGSGPGEAGSDPRAGFSLASLVEQNGRLVQQVDDRTIVTTLDPDLQGFAERLLRRYEVPDGAAVAINSRTGEVLVLAQHSTRSPGSNVALQADAPAASMFKVVTAAALLELVEAALTPAAQVCYHGGARRIQERHLSPNAERDTLCASLSSALGRSINVVFARLADQHLSASDLDRAARGFGFNTTIPFDLPLEQARADIPSERVERARMAAGFWHTHVSPLHAAVMAQAVAQGGNLLRPYVIDEVQTTGGEVVYDAHPQFIGRACGEQTAEALAEMMVVSTTVGTARSSFRDQRGRPVIQGVDVAGKTGTLHGRNPFRAYDWFMGFAPADDPEIAVAGLVVNDPRWRIKGHYVAREVLREYFRLQRRRSQADQSASQ